MRAHAQLSCQLTDTKNFNTIRPIGQTRFAQRFGVNPCSVIESIQRGQIQRDICNRMTGIIKSALGNAPDQWHLTAFETNSNGTSRTRGLAFAAATGGLSMTARFAVAKAFAPMFGAGPWFKIV